MVEVFMVFGIIEVFSMIKMFMMLGIIKVFCIIEVFGMIVACICQGCHRSRRAHYEDKKGVEDLHDIWFLEFDHS